MLSGASVLYVALQLILLGSYNKQKRRSLDRENQGGVKDNFLELTTITLLHASAIKACAATKLQNTRSYCFTMAH